MKFKKKFYAFNKAVILLDPMFRAVGQTANKSLSIFHIFYIYIFLTSDDLSPTNSSVLRIYPMYPLMDHAHQSIL